MIIHMEEFVNGTITMKKTTNLNQCVLLDDGGKAMVISVGDELFWVSNSLNQRWAESGTLTGFDDSTGEFTMMINNGISVHPLGCCYIGKMKGK